MTGHNCRDELTDEALDALLNAAGEDMLMHVRRTTEPSAVHSAMMNTDRLSGFPQRHEPMEVAPSPEADNRLALFHARLLSRTLVRTLARAIDRACTIDPTRDLAHDLNSALNLAGALHLKRALRFAGAHDVAGALDLTIRQAVDLADALARDRAHTRDLARTLDRMLAYARAHACARALDLARAIDCAIHLAVTLDRNIRAIPLDVSGLDLTQLKPPQDLDDLAGVMWNNATIWPPGLEERIRMCSQEVGSDVYQVRGRRKPDPVDLTFV